MELIYTDAKRKEAGYLDYGSADFAMGSSENDFEIELPRPPYPDIGATVFSEDGTLGGIVRGYKTTNTSQSISVTGVTWEGLLDSYVIAPPAGSDYLQLSGDVTDVVSQLVRMTPIGTGAAPYVRVQPQMTGIRTTHTFQGSRDSTQKDAGRYMGAWSAIWQVCRANNCKVVFLCTKGREGAFITVSHAQDLRNSEINEVAEVTVEREAYPNHLICLGKGELQNRTRVDVYADSRGNVSTTQTLKGINEIAQTYEETSAEYDELKSKGISKLKELVSEAQKVSVKAVGGATLDLGDLVGGRDATSGIEAEAVVTKKVAKVTQWKTDIDYTVEVVLWQLRAGTTATHATLRVAQKRYLQRQTRTRRRNTSR